MQNREGPLAETESSANVERGAVDVKKVAQQSAWLGRLHVNQLLRRRVLSIGFRSFSRGIE